LIFDEKTLRKVNALSLVANKVRPGVMKGERRSAKRGSGVDFADYRDYAPGDDLRRLDWNVFARLERPFIKLLEEEEDLAVHIVIDASRSMDWGDGECNKFTFALRLTAGLSAAALSTGDQLNITLLHGQQPGKQFGPIRGGQSLMRTLKFLEAQSAKGTTELNLALHKYAVRPHRPGLLILFSDLFSPAGFQQGLSHLAGHGHEIVLVHLLSPDEVNPPQAGDLRLLDIETGVAQEVTLDAGIRRLYTQRVQTWLGEVKAECLRSKVRYLPLITDIPWDKFILSEMRRAGVVK